MKLLLSLAILLTLTLLLRSRCLKEMEEDKLFHEELKNKHLRYTNYFSRLKNSYFDWSDSKIKPFPKPSKDVDNYVEDIKPFLQ